MPSQEIQHINIEDLVLWTENPRDPISPESSDQDIADKAFADTDGRWNLKKLMADMGEYYDYSELPIVVFDNGKPVVYDGNRRIQIGYIPIPPNCLALNPITPNRYAFRSTSCS